MSTLALFPGVPMLADSTDAQCTPRDLALDLGTFGIDPCSNPRSHIAAIMKCMLERGEDGLAHSWLDDESEPLSAFVNGPYSNPLPWCERLRAHRGPWCALWKLDPTTKWHAELLARGPNGGRAKWAPFRKRLAFEKAGNVGSADFPCMLAWRDWRPSRALLRWLWTPRVA
jgi:hypothetical protein